MRPDVKLGVIISAVVVLVAGSYFVYHDGRQRPIPIVSGQEASSQPVATAKPPRKTVTDAKPQPSPTPGQLTVADSSRSAKKPGRRLAEPGTTSGRRATPAAGKGPVRPRRVQAAGLGKGPRSETPGPSSPPASRAKRTVARQERSKRPVPLLAKRSGTAHRAPGSETEKGKVAVDTHRVQPGDTFSSLAQRYYGDVRFTRFLIESNPKVAEPDRLRVGAIVRIPLRPSKGASQGSAPATRSPRNGRGTYRVQPGDSFYAIARDVLGDASRWQELFALNKALVHGDPKHLQVGQIVVLPNP